MGGVILAGLVIHVIDEDVPVLAGDVLQDLRGHDPLLQLGVVLHGVDGLGLLVAPLHVFGMGRMSLADVDQHEVDLGVELVLDHPQPAQTDHERQSGATAENDGQGTRPRAPRVQQIDPLLGVHVVEPRIGGLFVQFGGSEDVAEAKVDVKFVHFGRAEEVDPLRGFDLLHAQHAQVGQADEVRGDAVEQRRRDDVEHSEPDYGDEAGQGPDIGPSDPGGRVEPNRHIAKTLARF